MKQHSRFLNRRSRFGSWTTEDPHRGTMPKKQPQEYPIIVEIEGKRYTGFYTVTAAGIITVDSDWGEVRADAGSKVELTASRLFLQILQGAKSRGELEDEA